MSRPVGWSTRYTNMPPEWERLMNVLKPAHVVYQRNERMYGHWARMSPAQRAAHNKKQRQRKQASRALAAQFCANHGPFTTGETREIKP